jgi:hypothetical protein
MPHSGILKKEFEDTKGVTRIRKSKKDRQPEYEIKFLSLYICSWIRPPFTVESDSVKLKPRSWSEIRDYWY